MNNLEQPANVARYDIANIMPRLNPLSNAAFVGIFALCCDSFVAMFASLSQQTQIIVIKKLSDSASKGRCH
jgi:hypothetical protein